MAFLEFERFTENNERCARVVGEFSLAGYNLLYRAWERRGKPLNEGWHVSASELILINSEGKNDISNRLLASWWNDGEKKAIGIVELLDVYGYTFESYDEENEVGWTPLMLRVGDIFWESLIEPKSKSQRMEILSSTIIKEPANSHESIEFLYLQGAQGGWNWGPTGRVNAAFLHDGARDYFRRFF